MNSIKTETVRVMQAIEELCAAMALGDRVPTHLELMRRFGASERTVLAALGELQRQGRIVRRHGAGTFVAGRDDHPVTRSQARTVVAIARPDHAFFDHCLDQLCLYTEAAGLELVCRPLRSGRETATFTSAAFGDPAGFLVFSYRLAPLAQRLQDSGSRVVLVGTLPAGMTPPVPTVSGAQEQGGYLAAKHLFDLGHRRIAFVHDAPDLARVPRWLGMLQAFQEARQAGRGDDLLVLSRDETSRWRTDPALAAAFVRRPDAPTGFLVWNDHEAAVLLAILTRAGVKVPEEVSLVGYDALPEGELVTPPLTTVDPYLEQMLQTAITLLTRPAPQEPSHHLIVPTLIVRESSAFAPADRPSSSD